MWLNRVCSHLYHIARIHLVIFKFIVKYFIRAIYIQRYRFNMQSNHNVHIKCVEITETHSSNGTYTFTQNYLIEQSSQSKGWGCVMQVNCSTYILLTLALYQLQIKKMWYPNSKNNFFVKKRQGPESTNSQATKRLISKYGQEIFVT